MTEQVPAGSIFGALFKNPASIFPWSSILGYWVAGWSGSYWKQRSEVRIQSNQSIQTPLLCVSFVASMQNSVLSFAMLNWRKCITLKLLLQERHREMKFVPIMPAFWCTMIRKIIRWLLAVDMTLKVSEKKKIHLPKTFSQGRGRK
jgi:hypothetical protein